MKLPKVGDGAYDFCEKPVDLSLEALADVLAASGPAQEPPKPGA